MCSGARTYYVYNSTPRQLYVLPSCRGSTPKHETVLLFLHFCVLRFAVCVLLKVKHPTALVFRLWGMFFFVVTGIFRILELNVYLRLTGLVCTSVLPGRAHPHVAGVRVVREQERAPHQQRKHEEHHCAGAGGSMRATLWCSGPGAPLGAWTGAREAGLPWACVASAAARRGSTAGRPVFEAGHGRAGSPCSAEGPTGLSRDSKRVKYTCGQRRQGFRLNAAPEGDLQQGSGRGRGRTAGGRQSNGAQGKEGQATGRTKYA